MLGRRAIAAFTGLALTVSLSGCDPYFFYTFFGFDQEKARACFEANPLCLGSDQGPRVWVAAGPATAGEPLAISASTTGFPRDTPVTFSWDLDAGEEFDDAIETTNPIPGATGARSDVTATFEGADMHLVRVEAVARFGPDDIVSQGTLVVFLDEPGTTAPGARSAPRGNAGSGESFRIAFGGAILDGGDTRDSGGQLRGRDRIGIAQFTGRFGSGPDALRGGGSAFATQSAAVDLRTEVIRVKGTVLASFEELPGQVCLRFRARGTDRGRLRLLGGTTAETALVGAGDFEFRPRSGGRIAMKGELRSHRIEPTELHPRCRALLDAVAAEP